MTDKKGTEYVALALSHRKALPTRGVGSRVIALEDAVDGQVTRTKKGVKENDQRALSKKLPRGDV